MREVGRISRGGRPPGGDTADGSLYETYHSIETSPAGPTRLWPCAERGFFQSAFLERQFQRQLNLARIASRRQESELGRAEGRRIDRILRSGLGKLQIGVIEHVEEFGAKFQLGAFGDREVFENREVPYLITRPLHAVAADIAKRSGRGIRERTSIEEGIGHATVCARVTDQIRTLLSIRICDPVRVQDREPVTRRDRGNPAH